MGHVFLHRARRVAQMLRRDGMLPTARAVVRRLRHGPGS